MTVIDNINTSIANIAANIAAETANPKPSYSVGNRSVSWSEWLSTQVKAMDELNDILLKLDPYQEVMQLYV